MVCECRFNSNKDTILVGDADKRGGNACVRVGAIWEVTVLSSQFCYDYETTLKKSLVL